MNLALATSLLRLLAPGEPPAPPIVLQLHELRGMPTVHADGGPSVVLFPTLSYAGGLEQGAQLNPVEGYVGVFRTLAADELQSEGRSASLVDVDVLRLRAPQAVQDLATGAFGFLEGAIGAQTELTFDSVTLPRGRAPSASLIPADEAAQLIAGAEARHGSWRTIASSSRYGTSSTTRTIPLAADYNVEIAQGAIAYDPIVFPTEVGTHVFAAAAPAPHGTWLALVVRSAELLGDVRAVDVPLASMIGSSIEEPTTTGQPKFLGATSPRRVAGPSRLEALAVQDRSFVLNTYLPEGRALVVTTSLDVSGVRGARALVVRRTGAALPQHAAFRTDARTPGSAEVLAIDLTSAHPPVARVSVSQPLRSSGVLTENISDCRAFLARPRLDDTYQTLVEALELESEASAGIDASLIGNWAVIAGPRGLGALGVGSKSPTDPLAVLERLRPAERVFQVTATLSRRGEAMARCSVALRPGPQSTIVLGTEDLEVADTDVEVAQSAATADPTIGVEFDGLVVRLAPRVERSGAASLEVAAWARARRGDARPFDGGSDVLPHLRLTTADDLLADEIVRFAAGDGPQRIRLGDRSDSGEGLTLELEMVELR